RAARAAVRESDLAAARRGRAGTPALETGAHGEARAVRAARVVERALVSAKPSQVLEAEEDESSVTRSRFANLFNLHRRPFREEGAEEAEQGASAAARAAETENDGSSVAPKKMKGKGSIAAELREGKSDGR